MTNKPGEARLPKIEKACEMCGTKVWPRAEAKGKGKKPGVVLCVVCLGKLIEGVTGWRLMRMFAQFVTLSPLGKGMSKAEKARVL